VEPKATVLMAHVNEGREPIETVRSMLETSPPGFLEILAFDDGTRGDLSCHMELAAMPQVRATYSDATFGLFEAKSRMAVGARAPTLIVVDAHMRFRPGWAEALVAEAEAHPTSFVGTACLGLGWNGKKDDPDEKSGSWSLDNPRGRYHGASAMIRKLVLAKGLKSGPPRHLLWMEPKWLRRIAEGPYELPCPLGACYAMTRAWWDRIGGLWGLRGWGGQEMCLSMRTWMAGGTCRIDPGIEVGHLFRSSAPHARPPWHQVYNRLRVAVETLPRLISAGLIDELVRRHGNTKAGDVLRQDMPRILDARSALGTEEELERRFWAFVGRMPPDSVGITPYALLGAEGRDMDNSITCARCGLVADAATYAGSNFPDGWACSGCGFARGTLRMRGKDAGWKCAKPGVAGLNRAAEAAKGASPPVEEGEDGD